MKTAWPRAERLSPTLTSIVRKRALEVNKNRRMLPHVAARIALGLGVLAASLSAAAEERAARFCTSRDIACAPGHNNAVQLARRWEPVVEWRFDRDLSNWQIKNYQQALQIEVADDAAWGRSLFVHRDDKEIDTAFELTSPPIPVAEAALCRLTIAAAHTLDLSMAQGHKESFQNQIRWLDRDGRVLEATPFRFTAPSDSWYDVTVESRAPRGAATAVVQIGFDSPNLFGSRQFRLRSVAWVAQPDPPQYAAEGQMISRPQRMAEPCERGSTPGSKPARCKCCSKTAGLRRRPEDGRMILPRTPSTCMLGNHTRCRFAQQGTCPSENPCREIAA